MDITGGRNPYNTGEDLHCSSVTERPEADNGPLPPGGAKYGAGYCDAQCPVGTWVNGTLNSSKRGACCAEMDLLEASGGCQRPASLGACR